MEIGERESDEGRERERDRERQRREPERSARERREKGERERGEREGERKRENKKEWRESARAGTFAIAQNLKLVAVPLYDLYENQARDANYISIIFNISVMDL